MSPSGVMPFTVQSFFYNPARSPCVCVYPQDASYKQTPSLYFSRDVA